MPRIRFRLLPALIASGVLVIGLRTADVASRLIVGSGVEPIRSAQAQDAKPAAASAPAQPAVDGAQSGQPPAPDRHATADATYSPAELDLLQSLAKRRDELDRREAQIQQREATMQVAQTRVEQKMIELASLKADLEKLLDLQKKKQDDETQSLVKIYSAMKAPDAARIFNTLDMPVLLNVVSHMKEQKAAAIIAAMSPDRAQELTSKLADLRQLPDGSGVDAGPAGAPVPLTPTAAQAAAAAAANAPPAPPPLPAATPQPQASAAPSVGAPQPITPQTAASQPAAPAAKPAAQTPAKPAG